MKSWLLPVRTLFGLALGAAVILAAGCAAVLRGPLYGADKLARSVWAVYRGVISEGFTVRDPRYCQNKLGQPGVHFFIANHPPMITTLILAAWVGVLMKGRVVIVMRAGVPFVSWVMRVTGVGVFIERGNFDKEAFQREVLAKLLPHEGHPGMLLYFPDRSRPRLGELESDHAWARQEHGEAYEAACFPAHLHTRVPRLAGLEALCAVLPADTTVTRLIVGHKGKPGWAIQPWDAWRPLMVRLVEADYLLVQLGDELRLSLYKAWAEAATTLEGWAKEE